MHQESKTLLLAKTDGLGEITMCGCGVVSLHLGAVTLRFETTALSKVEQMIQNALDSLCELAAQQPSRLENQHVH